MKIIVGLGNPGDKYKDTRHNLGFEVVDKMAEDKKFVVDAKFEAKVCRSGDFLLVKPSTFMNDSGRAVRKICDFYKQDMSKLIVIHDDLDLKLGEYKTQMGIGPKVHNGVNSVEQHMGGNGFLRLRLGIDNRRNNEFSSSGADYVLAKMPIEEKEIMGEIIEEAIEDLLERLNF